MRIRDARFILVIASLCPDSTMAQDALSLQSVLSRAREQAPIVLVAQARVDEAAARRVGAALRFQSNPDVEFAAGPRSGAGTTDVDAGIRQLFEPRGRRAARLESADASIEQAKAERDETARVTMRDAALTFIAVLEQDERLRLLRSALEVAQTAFRAAERRYRAGDIAVLDVNVARVAAARARAEIASTLAARENAVGTLRALLGLSTSPETFSGSLNDLRRARSLPTLLAEVAQHPELIRLRAEQREAQAERRFGRSFGRPEFGVQASYEREEEANIVLGGLTISLPTFNRGQELQAAATARETRVQIELDAASRALETRVRSLHAVYEQRVAAAETLEREALPGLDENEQLVHRSYEAGQLSLVEWLLLRREFLESRVNYVDQQSAIAAAGIELDAAAGVLR